MESTIFETFKLPSEGMIYDNQINPNVRVKPLLDYFLPKFIYLNKSYHLLRQCKVEKTAQIQNL